MSLSVRIYTFNEKGKRRRVREIDWRNRFVA